MPYIIEALGVNNKNATICLNNLPEDILTRIRNNSANVIIGSYRGNPVTYDSVASVLTYHNLNNLNNNETQDEEDVNIWDRICSIALGLLAFANKFLGSYTCSRVSVDKYHMIQTLEKNRYVSQEVRALCQNQ